MLVRKLPVLLCAPALLIFAGASHAQSVFSENFEGTTAALGVTTAGQFTAINGTNVDIVGPADGFGALCAAPESGNCVDMGGSGGNPAGHLDLTTSLNLAAGVYNLSFDLIGSQRGTTTSTEVIFGNVYDQVFTLASGDDTSGIVSVNLAVTGGPTQLQFIDLSAPNNIGALLDNVSVSVASPAAATPEPGSWLLLGTGLLGTAGMIRRRLRI